jgi:RNA ligase
MRKLDITRVRELVDQGWVTASKKHPTEDLTLYNYSPYTQYEGRWDEITLQCRGLILDSQGVAHSAVFPKFFNHTETSRVTIPTDEAFIAYEKMDGSFVESYWVGDEVFLCTKGSFDYERFIGPAHKILNTTYPEQKKRMKKGITYIFELIFPVGRIVVDYGKREDLVLTAVFDIATGLELDLDAENPGFPVPASTYYPAGTDVHALVAQDLRNAEGFVLKFLPSGLRMKGKYATYCHLHHIITDVTSYDIWEAIRDHGGISEEVLSQVPDEFYDWVKKIEGEIWAVINERQRAAEEAYLSIAAKLGIEVDITTCYPREDRAGRKLLAAEIIKLPGMLEADTFQVMVGLPVKNQLLYWQTVKPVYERPYDLTTEAFNQSLTDASNEGTVTPEVAA